MSARFATVFPKSNNKSKIAVISPAGAVAPGQLDATLQFISDKGYEAVLGKYVYENYSFGYGYAGTPEQRAEDLNWALKDDEIDIIWASRGGYGCQQLLEYIDIQSFKKNPKWYIGYSDNTVLQSFFLQNNIASIHGQTIKTSSFGVTAESYDLIFDILNGTMPAYEIDATEYNKNGSASGRLVGGNLALVYALLGTRYSFDFKDAILFIEDIGESYYSLDRMMSSLALAGVFDQINGLIIGGMTNMGNEKENADYEASFDPLAQEIIARNLQKYNLPVAYGFPNGHIKDNRPLIIGAGAKLSVGEKTVLTFNK